MPDAPDDTAEALPLVFSALGRAIPPGLPDVASYDVTAWPCGRKIWAPRLADATSLLTVIVRSSQELPADVTARIVGALDWGVAVELWARTDEEIDKAIAVVAPLLGGGHA